MTIQPRPYDPFQDTSLPIETATSKISVHPLEHASGRCAHDDTASGSALAVLCCGAWLCRVGGGVCRTVRISACDSMTVACASISIGR